MIYLGVSTHYHYAQDFSAWRRWEIRGILSVVDIWAVRYHTTHTHCGFATWFHAKTVSASAGRMFAFIHHVAFMYLRVYSMLLHLHHCSHFYHYISYKPDFNQWNPLKPRFLNDKALHHFSGVSINKQENDSFYESSCCKFT